MLVQATQHDVPQIMRAMLALLAKSPGPQMKYAEPVTAECNIRHAIHEGRGWMYDGYFIMVDVGSDWYTTKKFLIEQIIIRVQETTRPVRDAVRQLKVLAHRYGCVLIAAGDAQVGHMVHAYQDEGFKFLGVQLIQEIGDGIRTEDHGPAGHDRRGQEAEQDSAGRSD